MERNEAFPLEVVSVRLVRDVPILSDKKINGSKEAVNILGEILCEMDREMLCVIHLKADGIPINCHFVSMGTLKFSPAHPREIYKAAILANADSMILLHNHPSGSLEPSKADIEITEQILEAAKIMGIPLLDHLIIRGGSNKEYFSFAEKGIIDNPCYSSKKSISQLEFDTPFQVAQQDRGR